MLFGMRLSFQLFLLLLFSFHHCWNDLIVVRKTNIFITIRSFWGIILVYINNSELDSWLCCKEAVRRGAYSWLCSILYIMCLLSNLETKLYTAKAVVLGHKWCVYKKGATYKPSMRGIRRSHGWEFFLKKLYSGIIRKLSKST